MKTFPAGLAAHYAQETTSLATFLEVTRRDGVIVRFTGADRNVTVEGGLYLSAPGLVVTNMTSVSTTAVDSLELKIFPDADIPEADLIAGLWDFATYRLFETSYIDPTIGINLLRRGWTGVASAMRDGYSIELRSLKQALQQPIGAVTSKTCRYRLGDSGCLVDLTPWTHDYAVTSVVSTREFTCAGVAEATDTYGDGIATALDGQNLPDGAVEGYSQKIKTQVGGTFTLALAMPFEIEVGDTFRFIAGCRHRLLEDCRDKFDNVLNFGGEPHVPGADILTADPDLGGA